MCTDAASLDLSHFAQFGEHASGAYSNPFSKSIAASAVMEAGSRHRKANVKLSELLTWTDTVGFATEVCQNYRKFPSKASTLAFGAKSITPKFHVPNLE